MPKKISRDNSIVCGIVPYAVSLGSAISLSLSFPMRVIGSYIVRDLRRFADGVPKRLRASL